ncbi:glycosyltransferase family 39 protein [bacterium]|nr:glycosyltransferase family 39 protein [bacterium]
MNDQGRFFVERKEWIFLGAFALLKILLHLFTSSGYGYFRDELYYIVCTENPAFGYVDHPPFSIWLLSLVRLVLGDSLLAIRSLPAVLGGLTVFVLGLMVREFGGNRFAQAMAMLTWIASPIPLAINHIYSMNSLDFFIWATLALIFLLLLKQPSFRLWMVFGVLLGIGLMNKVSLFWLGIGVVAGLLLTRQRRQFLTPAPWIAAGIALLLFLPYLLWNMNHDWATLEFMRNARASKMQSVAPLQFFLRQLMMMQPYVVIISLLGIVYTFLPKGMKDYRPLAWYFIAIMIYLISQKQTKVYYLAPVYLPVLALGSVWVGEMLNKASLRWVQIVVLLLILSQGIIAAPFGIPVLPPEKHISYAKKFGVSPGSEEKKQTAKLPQYYADMFGWQNLAETVARVYNILPDEDKKQSLIYAGNYGEASAIKFFGNKYNLPVVMSSHNNYWIWGIPDYEVTTYIVVGGGPVSLRQIFNEVTLIELTQCKYCMPYEANLGIYVCRGLKSELDKLWEDLKNFQ